MTGIGWKVCYHFPGDFATTGGLIFRNEVPPNEVRSGCKEEKKMGLKDEIFEQPAVLQGLLETQWDAVRQIAEVIRERQVEYVFLAARGTSDHAGVYAQYLWGAHNRLPVALAAPSLFTLYEGSPRLQKALVLGISQSGQSPDIVSVVSEGRRQGALTLAVVNDPGSPLCQTAELSLDVRAGVEKAVAATKSYTAELLTLAMISAALSGDAKQVEALWQVPAAVQAALALDGEIEQIAAHYEGMSQCIVLGRGYNYATAQEWALKLKELTYVLADPYSAADFQHGPIAIVEEEFPVLAIAPGGAALADMTALLRRLQADQRAHLLAITDSEEVAGLAHHSLRLPASLPEWLTPLTNIVPAQLFCYHLTRAKGYDPEAPRGLRKVTLTH
jgi:glucosamine--fructose-6-phosphate aminotransferase (isomerizing)